MHDDYPAPFAQAVGPARFNRLWGFAEQMDWQGYPPKRFWRWLLRTLDRLNGHTGLDYDY